MEKLWIDGMKHRWKLRIILSSDKVVQMSKLLSIKLLIEVLALARNSLSRGVGWVQMDPKKV